MRDKTEGRKKQARSNKQQGNAAQLIFSNELPQVGFEPTTLYMYMYMYMYIHAFLVVKYLITVA